MKKLMFTGSVVALLVAAGASAQPRGVNAAPTARASVAAAVQARFVRADRDRDGFISRAEVQTGREAVRGQRLGQRTERRAERFARLDVNRDGTISRQEFDNRAGAGDRAERKDRRAERRAERLERRGERRAHRASAGFGPRAFERLDRNRDNRVSLAEATAARLSRFDRLDVNRDGLLSQEERRAARLARRNGA